MRQETRVSRYLTAVVATVAIGFVANVCRILSLVGYRTLFYPNVESAELHYLIGFAWLLPAVLGIALMPGRGLGHVRIPELIYWAVVLSLVSPVVASPGGQTVTLAALALLPTAKLAAMNRVRWYAWTLWLAVGGLIATTGMESLWLPWTLLCPTFVARRVVRSPFAWATLLGTIPVLAMLPVAPWLVVASVAWFWLREYQPEQGDDDHCLWADAR